MGNVLWSQLSMWNAPEPMRAGPGRPISASYRPTLVVGLGGTGCKLVQKLKRQVETAFTAGPTTAFQFVSLDLDVQSPPGQDELLGPDVFHNLAQPRIPIKNIVDNMRNYHLFSTLEAWWPYRPIRVNEVLQRGDQPYRPLWTSIAAGAMAVRPIGRFAVWHEGQTVRQLVENKWGQACHAREVAADLAASSTGKVYLICSLAGGTGGGMFLDIAYMLRSITENYQFPVFVTGVLLVDSTPFSSYAASPAIRDRMKANVYAALSELDYYMNNEPRGGEPLYRFLYGRNLEVVSPEHPFDVCYVLGVVNEGGRQLRDLEDISNMITEAIYLEMASPMAERGRSVLDNVENLGRCISFPIGDGQSKERRLAYSSLAVASLTYDREWTVGYCTPKLTFNALRWLIEGGGEMEGVPITAPAVSLANLRLNIGDIQQCREEHGEDCLQRCKQRLQDWMRERLLDQKLGMRAIKPAFKALVAMLADEQATARNQANQAEKAAAAASEEIRRLRNEIDRAKKEGRSGRVRIPALEADLQRSEAERREQLATKERLETVGKILSDLYAYGESVLPIFDKFIDEWDRFKGSVEKELGRFIKVDTVFGGHPLAFHALTTAGLNNLVQRFESDRNPVSVRVAQALQQGLTQVMADPASATLASLCEAVHALVRAAVNESEEIRKCDLFEIIRLCECDESDSPHAGIDHALRRLQLAAAPFWRVKEDLVPAIGEIAAINLVGYESVAEGGRPLEWQLRLPEILGQATPVAHGIPDKLILVQTRHGAPAYAIAASNPDLRRTYQLYMDSWASERGAQPVHLTDDWCRGNLEDMDPTPVP